MQPNGTLNVLNLASTYWSLWQHDKALAVQLKVLDLSKEMLGD
jgi:hypothetical protein